MRKKTARNRKRGRPSQIGADAPESEDEGDQSGRSQQCDDNVRQLTAGLVSGNGKRILKPNLRIRLGSSWRDNRLLTRGGSFGYESNSDNWHVAWNPRLR